MIIVLQKPTFFITRHLWESPNCAYQCVAPVLEQGIPNIPTIQVTIETIFNVLRRSRGLANFTEIF